MNRRVARILTWLYPPSWRERYAEEFRVFLEESDAGIEVIPEILYSAICEHLSAEGEAVMNSIHRALGLAVVSFPVAALSGINLVMTVDDSSLVAATRLHPLATGAWDVLAAAEVLCGAIVVLIAVKLYQSIIAYAQRDQRPIILGWLAAPFWGMAGLILWVAACMTWAHGQWTPSPWAILAKGCAPISWPSLQMRWICGIISVVLISTVGLVTAFSIKRAISLTDFRVEDQDQFGRRNRSAALASLLITCCTVVMLLSAVLWGLSVWHNDPDLVYQRLGLLNGSAVASWTISVVLLGFASAICIRASRRIFSADIEVLQ